MNSAFETNREKIISAARKVVSRLGVKNTTLKAIADAAGISKGTLYYYYKSKDDILYAVMEEDNALSKMMAEKMWRDGFDRDEIVRDIISGVMRRIVGDEKNRINLYLQGEALQGNRDLLKKYQNKYREWGNNVEDIVMKLYDVPRGPFTRIYACLFLAMVDGLCLQNLLHKDILGDSKILETMGSLLLGIKPEQMKRWSEKNMPIKNKGVKK